MRSKIQKITDSYHFLGVHTDRIFYTSEALQLQNFIINGWSILAATCYAAVTCSMPKTIFDLTKNLILPVYRRFFGTRPVIQSNRI